VAVTALPDRLERGGLILRAPQERDIPALIAACQDPEIPKNTRIPSPYGEAEATSFIERARQGVIDALHRWYVVTDGDDILLGASGVFNVNAKGAELEVGYWLAAAARGRGVATVSLTAVVAAALHAGFERLVADVLVGNDASCRVLERVGFVHEGISRSVADDAPTVRGPARINLHWYSLITSDPSAQSLLNGRAS
jgi:RimJ/RimL family protein N-acetyltransferase